MKHTFIHIHHHVTRHIKYHHRKYLFGLFGGFAVVKLFLLVIGLSVVEYTYNSTFAQSASGCILTGQYYTWEYQEWWYLTGQELVWWYLVDCITVPGYTWEVLDESWSVVSQIRVEESQTWCVLTGQTLSEGYMTGYYLTWGYWTGGTWECDEEIGTGDEVVGTWNAGTWDENTGAHQEEIIVLWWNGICESWDIVWNTTISWSVVRNIFSLTWAYVGTDCLSWLSLQLRDHNNQRIDLGSVPPWVTSYTFDSRPLYSFQQSGLYHIIWTGMSGQYYLYTGTYTGEYLRFFSWYKVRLTRFDQTLVSETPSFTIDNEAPILSWVSLLANGVASWYVTTSGVLTLTFTASELLTGVQAYLWSGVVPTSSSVSWLFSTYVRNLTPLIPQWPLALTITFADIAGNTGSVFSSWSFIYDTIRPLVSNFVFSGYTSGVYFTFSSSEPIRYSLSYQKTGWTILTSTTPNYLTAQQIDFSWLERGQLYLFTLHVFDRAGNTTMVTGDLVQTTLWTIISHTYVVPVSGTGVVATWNLATLAVVLKAEVSKFNVCKDALTYTPIELNVRNNIFTIQMPVFQKSQMKTLVNAFTLFVLNKVKNNPAITPEDIAEITKKFDSFLVILKLLRDDDNTCKQNLSNYHISQFKQTVEEFNLDID